MTRAAALAALLLAGAADAAMAPPPELDPACRPLIGVWQQVEPDVARGQTEWRIVSIDSFAEATTMTYGYYGHIASYGTAIDRKTLRCTAQAGGALLVEFLAPPDDQTGWSMAVRLDKRRFTATLPGTDGEDRIVHFVELWPAP
jgi:hypothetical protein